MKITVCAVGRLSAGPSLTLVEMYADRVRALGRTAGVSDFSIREVEAPKGLSGSARQEKESAALMAAAPEGGLRIALDAHGKALSSEDFAARLGAYRDDGARNLAFFIGGADGHARDLLDKADLKIAFGPATWPHMLVRAMLCEQLYRAITIMTGHPYHRA